MEIVDLTKPVVAGMQVYPGDPPVEIDIVQTKEEAGWEVRRLSMGSHTGTHVDAYSHIDGAGSTLDDIPLDRFYGPAICVDVEHPIRSGMGLIFREPIFDHSLEDILGATPPFVGGPSLREDLERQLLRHRIVIFDGLVNLDRLPLDRVFTFCGFPLKITHGDGSPVRAVAILD